MDQPARPNRRLRLQRRLRGWSQEDVAAGLYRVASSSGETDLGVDATMISRWERGTRHPRPRYVRLLSRLFDLPVEELGLIQEAEPGEADHGDFLERVAALLGMASVPPLPHGQPGRPEPWERLEWALCRPGQVDPATIDELERVTHALESLEPTAIGPRALLGPATGHMDAISMLLQSSLPSDVRNRLCSLAGAAAGLVGWLRWNLDDPRGASACFRAGLRAAREADDRALGAYLVGALACRMPSREAPLITLSLLGGPTQGYAQADATPAVGAWLAAKEADAWAQLHREDECLRALDRAEEIVGRLRDPEPDGRPLFMAVDRTWLDGERGASLARLGRLQEARAILLRVLDLLGPTNERDRLWLRAALAGVHADLDEPEEACRLAGSALAAASRMGLAPVVQLVVAVRERLEPHRRTGAVQELDEQLRALTSEGRRPETALR